MGAGFYVGGIVYFFMYILVYVKFSMGTRIAASMLDKGVVSSRGRCIVKTAIMTMRRPSKAVCNTMAGISNHCAVRKVHAKKPCGIRVSCINCGGTIFASVELRLNGACILGTALCPDSRRLKRIMIATSTGTGVNTSRGFSAKEVRRAPAISHGVCSIMGGVPVTVASGGKKVAFTNSGGHCGDFRVSNAIDGSIFKLTPSNAGNNRAGTGPVSVSTVRRVRIIITPFSIHRDNFAKNNVGTVAGRKGGACRTSICSCFAGRNLCKGCGTCGSGVGSGLARRSAGAFNKALDNPVVGSGLFFFTGTRGHGRSCPSHFCTKCSRGKFSASVTRGVTSGCRRCAKVHRDFKSHSMSRETFGFLKHVS